MKTKTTTKSEFPYGGKASVEQILALEEINKSKQAGVWESVRDLSRKVNQMDWSRDPYLLHEIESKAVHKDKERDW